MHDHVTTIIEGIVVVLVTAALSAWVYVSRKVSTHDVSIERLDTKMKTVEASVSHMASWQHEHEVNVREVLQRLARIEETLKHIHNYLNGKNDERARP